jgi:endonuclease YncB( thermonuclease family)
MTIKRTVKKVIDGDTFITNRKVDGTNRVRLVNYNAPELYQYGGREAKQRLVRNIQGRTLTLQPVGRSYNRVVADVRYNRRKVNR